MSDPDVYLLINSDNDITSEEWERATAAAAASRPGRVVEVIEVGVGDIEAWLANQ